MRRAPEPERERACSVATEEPKAAWRRSLFGPFVDVERKLFSGGRSRRKRKRRRRRRRRGGVAAAATGAVTALGGRFRLGGAPPALAGMYLATAAAGLRRRGVGGVGDWHLAAGGLLFLALLLWGASGARAFVCLPCDESRCEEPKNCPGGVVLDICGCCFMCARQRNESCGGFFGLHGACDRGLRCVIRPPLNGDSLTEYEAGVCEGKRKRKQNKTAPAGSRFPRPDNRANKPRRRPAHTEEWRARVGLRAGLGEGVCVPCSRKRVENWGPWKEDPHDFGQFFSIPPLRRQSRHIVMGRGGGGEEKSCPSDSPF